MSDNDMLERRNVLRSIAAIGLFSAGTSGVEGNIAGNQSSDALASDGIQGVVPAPVTSTSTGSEYAITSDTTIHVESKAAAGVANYLAGILRPSTGNELPVVDAHASGAEDSISLLLTGAPTTVGEEGYRLNVNAHGVTIRANEPPGLFAGVQTLRQLLPPTVEKDTEQPGPWTVPGGHILDYPRFSYRGAHLDIARHFFSVDSVKQYIEYLAQYKMNHLHLHLTDDQGWRIEIESWPKLTKIGGSTEVGGGPGGYYTQSEYRELVEYAQDRFITVIPEIDMPGHTNAALASYAELNCDGEREDLYTGTSVGFSSLCVDKEITYEFIDDVIREVSEITPGPYIHIGGDEAHETSDEEYDEFMDRAVSIVEKHDKRPVGWHQILDADPPESTVAQYWYPGQEAPDVAEAARDGIELIASPASHAYLDMKYTENTELGLDWAGLTTVEDAYSWDPGKFLEDVDESAVKGPETALWSETLETLADIEFMLFPRMPAVAELGWSPESRTAWEGFRQRLAAQGSRWDVQNVNYYESPLVAWPR